MVFGVDGFSLGFPRGFAPQDLKLTVHGEMDIAYRGEIQTPSRCGRMDQCVAFGRAVPRRKSLGNRAGFNGEDGETMGNNRKHGENPRKR